jgi:hypothetical protein
VVDKRGKKGHFIFCDIMRFFIPLYGTLYLYVPMGVINELQEFPCLPLLPRVPMQSI